MIMNYFYNYRNSLYFFSDRMKMLLYLLNFCSKRNDGLKKCIDPNLSEAADYLKKKFTNRLGKESLSIWFLWRSGIFQSCHEGDVSSLLGVDINHSILFFSY